MSKVYERTYQDCHGTGEISLEGGFYCTKCLTCNGYGVIEYDYDEDDIDDDLDQFLVEN